MRTILSTIFLLAFLYPAMVMSQKIYPLFEKEIPNSKPISVKETRDDKDGRLRIGQITEPTIEAWLPTKESNTGTAIIIFPGGGYRIVSYSHEGTEVAKKFQQMGVTAFVVKYRMPDSATMENPSIGPLQDAQRAIQWVRERSTEFNVNPERVGVLGFSAGGHLASTAGTHFSRSYISNPKAINLRPDFMILVYPVVTMAESFTHAGSVGQLLGKKPSDDLRSSFSAERNVTPQTPPAFLVHTSADKSVSALNSVYLYKALLENNIKAEMHIYQEGNHGFGLKLPNADEWWMDRCRNWLAANGWLKK